MMSAAGYDPFPPRDAVDRVAGALVQIALSKDGAQVCDLKEIATADRRTISDAVLRLRDYRFSLDRAASHLAASPKNY